VTTYKPTNLTQNPGLTTNTWAKYWSIFNILLLAHSAEVCYKTVIKITPHLNRVATLPCEIYFFTLHQRKHSYGKLYAHDPKCDHGRWAGITPVKPATNLSYLQHKLVSCGSLFAWRSLFQVFKETSAKKTDGSKLLCETVENASFSSYLFGGERTKYWVKVLCVAPIAALKTRLLSYCPPLYKCLGLHTMVHNTQPRTTHLICSDCDIIAGTIIVLR